MESQEGKDLLERYAKGQCSEEEKLIVDLWFEQHNSDAAELSHERILALQAEIYQRLPKPKPMILKLSMRIATIAASIIFLWGIWTLLFVQTPKSGPYDNDIAPGSNKAILTLANGTQINLSDAKAGTLSSQAGLEIIKDKDGQISYKVSESSSATNEYNTITTPRGGQYIVTLPDGSKIWLNAASTLEYPIGFASKSREVKLSGEAYFEVSKNKEKPFMVHSTSQVVEVLGTHFNISTYNDEAIVKTTLLEGSVRVSLPNITSLRAGTDKQSVVLKPNEQSSLFKNSIQIKQVDPDEAVAWRDGKFLFRSQPLEQVMNKLSRWYDVEVVYEDKSLSAQVFSGIIARSEKISRVLQALEATGEVHFKVEGRRVIVKK